MIDSIPSYTPSQHNVYRVISTRYPNIDLYEDVASPDEFEALFELEALTNDRIRDTIGNIDAIPIDERVFGPGCTHIMASFTHVNPLGGRFNTGMFGAYYCANTEKTAVHEVKYHRERFFKESRLPTTYSEEKVIINQINPIELHNIIGKQEELAQVYNPNSYITSQQLAQELRQDGSKGISYSSVRHEGGICHALFKPNTLTPCVESKKLRFHWNGHEVHYVEQIKLYDL